MRLIPLLTAIVVSGILYLAVFERDRLLAFARGEATDQQSEAEDDPVRSSVAKTETPKIGVVV